MALLDWIIVVCFLGAILAVGLLMSRRASGSLANFFLSGRSLPWWLAGTSMLATSFASDTPLHFTRVIRESGLAGAWFYWNGIFYGLVITFFFSRLWRRSSVLTDVQLTELRYEGRSAALLRVVLAFFRAGLLEALTMGWVILGMTKVVTVIMDLPPALAVPGLGPIPTNLIVVVGLLVLALVYSVASGLWGVVATDFVEFLVAMSGAVVLMLVAYGRVGWASGLRTGLAQAAPAGTATLDFLPWRDGLGLGLTAFAVYVGIQWWSNAEIDGSGKRAQRFLACKDERHAVWSGLWNMAVQWVIRSWPWYLTGLCSLVLYPHVVDHETVYPMMMRDLLPIGLKGLMVASFLAAFMSTIDTHLNISAAYFVNDLYRRFLVRDRDERHYLLASRLALVGLMVLVGAIALQLDSILFAFRFKLELSCGLGLVIVLRWYWWRINAWSELAALATSVLTTILLHTVSPLEGAEQFPLRLAIIVCASATVMLAVTLLTRPVPEAHLVAFYRQVRPAPRLWGAIPARAGVAPERGGFKRDLTDFGISSVAVFAWMFFVGKLLLAAWLQAGVCLLVGAAASVLIYRRVIRSAASS